MVKNISLNNFIEELSCSEYGPGGGSCCALSGAFASGLVLKVLSVTAKKKLISSGVCFKNISELKKLNKKFLALSEKDIKAYNNFLKAKTVKLKEKKIREAINVSFEILGTLKKLSFFIEDILNYVKGSIVVDLLAASCFMEASVKISVLNININLKNINSEEQKIIKSDANKKKKDFMLWFKKINKKLNYE
jgi:formiminotetrahydrofolate cyclodeaminase